MDNIQIATLAVSTINLIVSFIGAGVCVVLVAWVCVDLERLSKRSTRLKNRFGSKRHLEKIPSSDTDVTQTSGPTYTRPRTSSGALHQSSDSYDDTTSRRGSDGDQTLYNKLPSPRKKTRASILVGTELLPELVLTPKNDPLEAGEDPLATK